MRSHQSFWNKNAKKYAASPVEDEAAYKEKLSITQSYLKPNMRLLEFGCGTGSTAIIHAPHVNSILAVDYSDEMIAIARKKAADANVSNIEFKVEAIENLSAQDAQFDMVLGLSIIHLLNYPQDTVNHVFELVKPGGVFVSSTVCISESVPMLRHILPLLGKTGLIPNVNPFRVADVVQLLESAGFIIEKQWQPSPKAAVFIVARRPD